MTTLAQPLTTTRREAAVLCQRYAVVGMTCSHCEHTIAAEVSALPGVTAVTADAAAGTVIIESARELDRSEVAAAVDEAGYELGPMNTTTRLAGFGVALVTVLGLGAGVGAAVGPSVAGTEAEAPAPIGQGVVAAAEGYRLVPVTTDLDGNGRTFRFAIEDQSGEAVREFIPIHERDLHLIVVNRELTTFHHVHPILGLDGVWSIDLPALDPGSYRAIADFQIAGGPRLALGTDLTVAGQYQPIELGEPTSQTTTDGYEVQLTPTRSDDGHVTADLIVRRHGALVTDLEPYLGANGHLVAMRTGDLAYAHVHPVDDGDTAPGVVRFTAELTSAGRYGLFFDFKHNGKVHTASFTFDQGPVTGSPDMEMGNR